MKERESLNPEFDPMTATIDLLAYPQQAGKLLLKREEYKKRLEGMPYTVFEGRYDVCKHELISLLFETGRMDFETALERLQPKVRPYVEAYLARHESGGGFDE